MKTDLQLQRDVADELRWEPSIRDNDIAIAAKDGVVTLAGFVDSYAEKFAAERAVEHVGGVRAIVDDLKVKLPGIFARTDTDIAHAVTDALQWDIQVPDDRITAKVSDGWITLEGEVAWRYQKDAAVRAVRYLTGVRGVTDLVTVKPKRVSTFEVSSKIKDALRRSAELDAGRIIVEAADGRITLKGHVRSWAERQDAERAAWGAPGVTNVEDELVITM